MVVSWDFSLPQLLGLFFHDPTTSRVLTVKEIEHCKFFVLVICIFFYEISLFRTNFQFLVGLFISLLFSFSVLYYSRQYPSIRNIVGNFSLILQILFFPNCDNNFCHTGTSCQYLVFIPIPPSHSCAYKLKQFISFLP